MTSSRSFFVAFCFGMINLIALLSTPAIGSDFSIASDFSKDISLDREIETLKKNVLTLNSDLMILEEELLFPPRSQISIFLSIEQGVNFPLAAITLEINDQLVAKTSYTRRALDAFAKGGIQRLYIGNLSQGRHTISAAFTGAGKSGGGAPHGSTFKVTKYHQPTLIELRIVNTGTRENPQFGLERWLL